MKIALVTHFATHYRYSLFKLLSQSYCFDLFFFDSPQKTKEDIKHLTIYKDKYMSSYFSIGEILGRIRKNKYNVVIKCTNNKWAFLGSFIISKLIRAKFVVWHSIWYYPKTLQYTLFSKFYIKLLKDCTDAIIVYGEHGKRFLVEKGISPEKIFIAWQTVNREICGRRVSNGEIELIRNRYNIPLNKKIILYVGRLQKFKGVEYLLNALRLLDTDKFIFTLIGHGQMKAYIGEFCKKYIIDYRYIGLLPHYELPPFYKMAAVLVLPSITTKNFKEPWGLVVNEAFNQGCPVIVTDAVGAGVGGLVKNGIHGFVVPEKNAHALAQAIIRIVDDNDVREEMSRNTLKEIKKWTYNRQAKGFLEAVNYALRKNGAS